MRASIIKTSAFIIALSLVLSLSIAYLTKTNEETDSKITPNVFSIKHISYFLSETIAVNNYEICLKDHNLYLRVTDNSTGMLKQETYISTPTPTDWGKFNKSLLQSKACLWDKSYADMSFEDGGETEINIEFHNCKIQTTAINTNPPAYSTVKQSMVKNLFNGKHLYDMENSIEIM